METKYYRHLFYRWLPGIILFAHLLVSPAFAADGAAGGGWRSSYDEIMRWINFAIFVLVIVKFGRTPLMDFLKGRKKEVADEIEQVESKKQQAEETAQRVVEQLEDSSRQMEKIKARIVRQGERRKSQIIADAQSESETMLKVSKVKIAGQIADMRERLRSEMIDQAIDIALKRLPGEMTEQDNHKIVDTYLQQAMSD